jgi:hypothetical protein
VSVFTMTSRQAWVQAYWHEVAAIAEGLCPVHHAPLTPAGMPPGVTGGLCGPCGRYWGCCPETRQSGWHLATSPRPADWLRVEGL